MWVSSQTETKILQVQVLTTDLTHQQTHILEEPLCFRMGRNCRSWWFGSSLTSTLTFQPITTQTVPCLYPNSGVMERTTSTPPQPTSTHTHTQTNNPRAQREGAPQTFGSLEVFPSSPSSVSVSAGFLEQWLSTLVLKYPLSCTF